MPADAITPTPEERDRRRRVVQRILDAIREDRMIKLPAFDVTLSRPAESALVSVGIEPNDYGGTVGSYRYQLEGEEDLLHLIVTRSDGQELTPEEGQSVAAFLFPEMPPGLMWLKPGLLSQHFYMGHDELPVHLRL